MPIHGVLFAWIFLKYFVSSEDMNVLTERLK